jgi:hypothetical protein
VRELGDERRQAGVLTNLGLAFEEAGDLSASAVHHTEALGVYRRLGDATGVARVELNLAVLAKLEGRPEDARRLLASCMPRFRKGGDARRMTAVLLNLGEMALAEGQAARARWRFEAALRAIGATRDRVVAARTLIWLALACVRDRDARRGAVLASAGEAMTTTTQAGLRPAERSVLQMVAHELERELEPPVLAQARSDGLLLTYDAAMGAALEARSPEPLDAGD